MRVTATPAVAANSGASIAAPPAARVRSRLRNPLAACLIALAVTAAAPAAHPAQPPGAAAAELAASGRLDAALTLLDGWLAEHPGDERLFPTVLQVVTAAPEKRTVDAVLGRYEGALAADSVGVLRAVPADWAELRGGVEQALDELRRSRLPDAGRRQAVLLLELGQLGNETPPREVSIALHAGLARAGQGLDDSALEDSLRRAFAMAGQADGGADAAVAGYGLVALLSATGRSTEAAAVLAELGRRYPRSPEYALAAAELRGGHGAVTPPVVALPSPAMLLGSAALVCPAPCSIPVAALPQPAAPAAQPRPAAAAGEATRSPSAAAPASARPPDRVVLVPARVPAAAAGPQRRAEGVPAAPSTVPSATTDDGRRRAAAAPAAAALRSAPPARSGVEAPRLAGGVAAAPVAAPAATAAPDRGPELAASEVAPAPAVTSRPAPDTAPRPEAGSGVTIRVVAAPGRPAAVTVQARSGTARASAPDAGNLIRVSAQPATRPLLPTDRVFVPAEPRAGSGARSQAARASAVAAGAVTARAATARASSPSPSSSAVRVASLPDPAAFAVQVGAYIDPDNALEMEAKLRQAGFPAIARSYRDAGDTIVHRVGVGGNVTRAKGEQVLTRLSDAGFDAYISRRDVVSYLPPAPRRR